MHFGENQLSRSLIGLSPLPTTHPLSLQPKWVRASTRSYPRFTLAMGRSLRFGSRTHHYTTLTGGYALFRLAFAAATPHGLTSRHVPDSQAHSSKGTPSPHDKSRALTACRHTVSGTLSLPSRGTFHHSLTVLIRYRSSGSIQAYRVVPADSQQIPRARCYSGNNTRQDAVFTYRALTVYGRPSQATSINHTLTALRSDRTRRVIPTTPHTQPLPGYPCARFSHPPRSLATTHGITLVFFSYGY